MSKFKNYKIAITLSASLTIILLFLTGLFFYFLGMDFGYKEFSYFIIMALLFFIFSVVLIHFRIERFILKKVKGIYSDLMPSGASQNKMTIQSDMEVLKKVYENLLMTKSLKLNC